MKKTELLNIIENLVKKEVKKQVKEIFIKEGKVTKKPMSMDDESYIDQLLEDQQQGLGLTESVGKTQPTKKKQFVEYTKDATINKILNETKGGIPSGQGGGPAASMAEQYKTMGGGAYTTDRMGELMSKTAGNPQAQREIGAVQSMKAQNVSSEQVPEDVKNALTRDYSQLMKAINKKKG
tara:strand:+ start:75 stop:614 length:540 start_codon:yes stop_codon:yes gene_type:complete